MSDSRPKSSRRDFLKGKSAADAIGDIGRGIRAHDSARSSTDQNRAEQAGQGQIENPLHPADEDQRSYLVEVSRRAMACSFEVFLNAGEHEASTELAIEALDLVEQLEAQLTVYRNDSEVSELNAIAARRAIFVEAGFYKLLKQCIEIHRATDAAFDITSGPLIQAWGKLRREGQIPTEDELASALERVGSQFIELDDRQQSVRFARPGVSINLGGIGKGYALDRCASRFAEAELTNFLIHGGSSSIYAHGSRQSGTGRRGWCVGIQHPSRSDRRLLELQLVDAALGTSGAGTKQFYFQGKRYGHIIDPRTGLPVDGVLSTTVVAPSGALADALSTAFYVLGVERARQFCEQHPDVSVFMTTPAGGPLGLELHTINCERIDWTLTEL